MNKLEIYSSFDAMKDSSTAKTVSPVVLAERYEKFENFIHFIRDEVRDKSPSENNTPKVK